MRLNSHKLNLRRCALHEHSQSLATNNVDFCNHQMSSHEQDSELSEDHLGVNLDETKSAGAVEGPPRLNEERAAGATDGHVEVAHHGLLVERYDRLLAFWEEGGFDAG